MHIYTVIAVRVVAREKRPRMCDGLNSRLVLQTAARILVSTVKKLKYRIMVSVTEATRFARIK
jgi:hypothetical protein